jgi:hypothetical protein
MLKKMAIAAIIVGLACLVVGVCEKVMLVPIILRFSPIGFGQGAVIFLLLSINLLLLDKNS